MVSQALFTSNKEHWETPQYLFDKLHAEFQFTIDLAASDKNHKLPRYYTKDQNSLAQLWVGERGFLNPPYGRKIGAWIQKAYETHRADRTGGLIVALLPARTCTRWFHRWIYGQAEIRFIKGRLKFELEGVPSRSAAPFPSMIVVWR